jgi:hypothetical protein
MPRDGSNIYHIPPGTTAVPDTTVASAPYNSYTADVEQDLNLPRPIVAGGTGANSADQALINLLAEKSKQVITNFDSATYMPGSFYAAATATGAPVAGHAFAGICYYADATNFVLEARDLTDTSFTKYLRVMSGGVWGAWALSDTGTFVKKAGDTMTGNLTVNGGALTVGGVVTPVVRFTPVSGSTVNAQFYQNADSFVFTGSGNIYVVNLTTGAFSFQSAVSFAVSPTAPTPAAADNSTNLATTAFVRGSTVRYDGAQALTDPQMAQARQNIFAAPFDALAFNGMQINGGFDVTQELQSGVGVAVSGIVMDGWRCSRQGTSAGYVFQLAGNYFPGMPNAIGSYVTTAEAALAAGSLMVIYQYIEGYRVARLQWGSAFAQPLTIGFWTGHHRTGTYTGIVRNSAGNRTYAFSYTQNVADATEFKTVTIPGDTAGTWLKDNGIGLVLMFAMACGSTNTAPSLNTWLAGGYAAGPGQVNALGATTDYFRLGGVIVLPGIELPPASRIPYIMRPFDQELALCQRYYRKSYDYTVPPATVTNTGMNFIYLDGIPVSTHQAWAQVNFAIPMRAAPTVTLYSPGDGVAARARDGQSGLDVIASVNWIGQNSFSWGATGSSSAGVNLQVQYVADARL